MSSFKLALVQLDVGADKAANLRRAANAVADAAKRGARLICLPECFNSPYGTEYFERYAEEVPNGETAQMLSTMARESSTWLVGGTIPERCANSGKIYNTCCTFAPDGRLVGKLRKIHLCDINIPGRIINSEPKVLTAGDQLHIVDTGFCKLGLGICYDLRFPELAQVYADHGCNLLLYPSAFNMTTGPAHWELLCRARALDDQLYCGVCSPARNPTASYQAWGYSLLADPWGAVVSSASDETSQIVLADVDLARLEEVRNQLPVTKQRRLDIYQRAQLVGEQSML